MRFLQIKLHHDFLPSKDYQKAKYEENRCLHLCRPMFVGYRQSLLTIRQRGRVVYELIVNEGAARVDYLFRDNEAELFNCFSIQINRKYKL